MACTRVCDVIVTWACAPYLSYADERRYYHMLVTLQFLIYTVLALILVPLDSPWTPLLFGCIILIVSGTFVPISKQASTLPPAAPRTPS